MKLRVILIALSLLAVFSASSAGYLYYASSKKAALTEADRHAAFQTEMIKDHLSANMAEYLKSVRAMAGLPELEGLLSKGDETLRRAANVLLDHFCDALKVDVCYLMDSGGKTVASSNRNDPDSFVGENYSFRPYYRQAMEGRPAIYMALGITSKKRGVYYSHPVYAGDGIVPAGVVVIKASIHLLERDFAQDYEGIVSLVDPHGLAFISNREEWLYHFLWKPSPEDIAEISAARQFGEGPWNWTGLQIKDASHAVDLPGAEYVIHRARIANYPGWEVIYLQSLKAIERKISVPLMKMTGLAILTICVFIGLLVSFLYRKASDHISQRRAAEEALRESQKTAMALLNAPTEAALLLDTEGSIISLNRPAADRFGKGPGDLIGSCSFNLFSPEVAKARRAHHMWVVRSGRPCLYEDVREGRWYNTNLYPIFDQRGSVIRVAVFSRDVTEQKRAEQALERAKEELTQYSRELEKRVKKGTREITDILRYTPAVVFIKDREGRYTLVNSKFEELFRLRNEDIQGKRDVEVFSREIAEQFRKSERQVLEEGKSIQVEEKVEQDGDPRTYLAVKFPLYDEQGSVRGLCGIATDITPLKKAQDLLRRLSGSIMASQEKERAAIARELHDELGQMLTALRIDCVWIYERLRENNAKVADRALGMCDVIDKTIDEVRGISIRLRPGVLDDLGLIPALEWYATEFENRTGIACRFHHEEVSHVDEILATAAYRIAQEALTNVARHSMAGQVDVILRRENGALVLSVIDDGQGIEGPEVSESECLGIVGMRERASLVGGSLEIACRAEKGTEVVFRVPVQGQKEANP
ncbi:MAG: PAS domain-containing protein [Deltaproteobacteria bacterium]|nr:PAS domain-containing protein [Deltaproteobacteria bacterium]